MSVRQVSLSAAVCGFLVEDVVRGAERHLRRLARTSVPESHSVAVQLTAERAAQGLSTPVAYSQHYDRETEDCVWAVDPYACQTWGCDSSCEA